MTKNELTNLYFLNREIELIKKNIADINYKVKFVKKYTLDEKKAFEKEAENFCDILSQKQGRCFLEQARLENFINKIPSSEMRTILAYRYINGLSWKEISFNIGNCDESYIRKKHNAFLDNFRKENGGEIKID